MNNLKQSIGRKLLLLVLPILLAVGFTASSALADNHHDRGRGRVQRAYRGGGNRHAYRGNGGYYGGRGYRHGSYGDRHRHGYWRYRHGRRYWYEDGGYFLYPGGTSINIVL